MDNWTTAYSRCSAPTPPSTTARASTRAAPTRPGSASSPTPGALRALFFNMNFDKNPQGREDQQRQAAPVGDVLLVLQRTVR
ncbi:hypothetical protein LV779_31955 [Streptomyces thinghirensis]|nr:hypothetical protein [Streptomyces thinghirensis]